MRQRDLATSACAAHRSRAEPDARTARVRMDEGTPAHLQGPAHGQVAAPSRAREGRATRYGAVRSGASRSGDRRRELEPQRAVDSVSSTREPASEELSAADRVSEKGVSPARDRGDARRDAREEGVPLEDGAVVSRRGERDGVSRARPRSYGRRPPRESRAPRPPPQRQETTRNVLVGSMPRAAPPRGNPRGRGENSPGRRRSPSARTVPGPGTAGARSAIDRDAVENRPRSTGVIAVGRASKRAVVRRRPPTGGKAAGLGPRPRAAIAGRRHHPSRPGSRPRSRRTVQSRTTTHQELTWGSGSWSRRAAAPRHGHAPPPRAASRAAKAGAPSLESAWPREPSASARAPAAARAVAARRSRWQQREVDAEGARRPRAAPRRAARTLPRPAAEPGMRSRAIATSNAARRRPLAHGQQWTRGSSGSPWSARPGRRASLPAIVGRA